MAPSETMMLLGKSCWLLKNGWGKRTKRNHSFQYCNIMEMYMWTTTWASSSLRSTANHNFRDLQKSLIYSCEADASREVLNSNASGLRKKEDNILLSPSLFIKYTEMLSKHGLKFFPSWNQLYFLCIQPIIFCMYSSAGTSRYVLMPVECNKSKNFLVYFVVKFASFWNIFFSVSCK